MAESTENSIYFCEEEIDRLLEALKQLGFQNQMLVEWVNGAVITVDCDGNILSANEVAQQDIGWSEEELIGRKMHAIMHHSQEDGSEYPWEFSPVFAAIEDGSSHHVDGDVFWHKDGSSLKVDYIVSPTRDEKNKVTGGIVIFRNLTALKLIEAKRIHNMKLQSIGELAAGIAHEINTPIQYIGSNVDFLEESFSDMLSILNAYGRLGEKLRKEGFCREELAEIDTLLDQADIEYLEAEAPMAFQQTQEGVERVTKLVLGLKGFAHSSSNEKKKETDLNGIINNALIVSHNTYKYVADLETDLADLPLVAVYPEDIGQVVINLLVNAAHAIEDANADNGKRGTISVRTMLSGNHVEIQVVDSGSGIPDRIKERIFDPFFTTKEVGRGSGQGLAICRTIIREKHGGELSFVSEVGKGTTFTVRLPVH